MAKAHTVWACAEVPRAVQELLDDPSADVTHKSDPFWFLVAALKRFLVRPLPAAVLFCHAVQCPPSSFVLCITLVKCHQRRANGRPLPLHCHAAHSPSFLDPPATILHLLINPLIHRPGRGLSPQGLHTTRLCLNFLGQRGRRQPSPRGQYPRHDRHHRPVPPAAAHLPRQSRRALRCRSGARAHLAANCHV
jgi:hypothetical protein